LHGYLRKATREAKRFTSWTHPHETYDTAVETFCDAVLSDDELVGSLADFVAGIEGPTRVAVLGQKLVQLAMPGVPDVYQGCEVVDLSLVDPDNRRDVDFDARRARLARLDAGEPPADLDDEKLLVTSRTLRLRRDHPEWFTGTGSVYVPVATSTGNAVAFGRGQDVGEPGVDLAGTDLRVVAVVTRLPVALARHGGWGEHTLTLPDAPEGSWRDVLTGRTHSGGPTRLSAVLTDLPVALLVRS
jgi:(1->4)-alpha-D-glucan 1-alpha-D-glucosylmutase